MRLSRLGWVVLSLSVAAPVLAADPKFTSEQLRTYELEVKPIFKANCLKCHGEGEGKPKGGLSLTGRKSLIEGGDSGSAIDLEKPNESLILKAVRHEDDLKMPPKGKISAKEIDTLVRWVKAGAPMPAGELVKHAATGGQVTEEAKKFWAYQPVRRPAVPTVKNPAWVINPIDAFILAKMESKGLSPTTPAGKLALIRRAYYDLTGLPPTPAEIDRFINDADPQAYEKLVDRLLESKHYGEKWGRHWLDVVRYAETNGYERDGAKPFAWRYRDYVIKSFNDDKPYDQFIREQLAGDEIGKDDPNAIIATGYYRLGIWDDEPADMEEARFNEFDDWVATTGQVFLGMTMNCARCHDHKIDPIPQADYYRMVAFFRDVQHYSPSRDTRSKYNLTDITPAEKRKTYEAEPKERESRIERLTEQTVKLENEAIKKMPAEDQRAAEANDRPAVVQKVGKYFDEAQKKEYARLKNQIEQLKRRPTPSQEFALSVNNCQVKPPQTHVMIRGSAHAPGAKVEPGFPQVLGFPDPVIPPPGPGAKSTGRRTVLANWIASKENPSTARVMVNRIWQHHFGRGIVASTNDFGKFGTLPTHPELLDWLASEFMADGWKLKSMHRKIMMSNTYRLSSTAHAAGLKSDPDNQWFWRFNMRRLTAEEVRDSFLAVSGSLNLKAGGPSIYPKISREVLAGQSVPGQGWHTSPPEEANRRSVYVHIKRSLLVPVLSMHDQADTDSSCPVRYTTTVPTQALGMLNGEFSNETAESMAIRCEKEAPNDLNAQIRLAIRLTTGRQPSDDEVAKDAAFVGRLRKTLSPRESLRRYALLALNANEFVYLD